MPTTSVELPRERESRDGHAGEDRKFVDRSEAVRTAVRKTPDIPDEADARHGRPNHDE